MKKDAEDRETCFLRAKKTRSLLLLKDLGHF